MKITYDLSEIDSIAAHIIEHTKSKVLLFYGEMGVGKTTLIKALAKQLGIEETVSSPTFSIVNEYRTSQGDVIYHFDLYRIKELEELDAIGFEEYLDHGDWIWIEWPERIHEYPLESHQNVYISIDVHEKRILRIN